jgi:hypothetical protein
MSSIRSGDEESMSEAVLRAWETSQARSRSRSSIILPPGAVLSGRSAGDYADEVSYNVTVSQGSVSVEMWGSGSHSASLSVHSGGAGGSSQANTVFRAESNSIFGGTVDYWTDEGTGVQMALSDGDTYQPICRHDLVIPVTLLYTVEQEVVANLCELCGEQLPAKFRPPTGPISNSQRELCNRYGEPIARWTTQTGEWVIVRD